LYKFCFASVRSLATLIRAAIGERSTGISKPRRKSVEPIVGWLAAQRADPISVTFFGYCAARGRKFAAELLFSQRVVGVRQYGADIKSAVRSDRGVTAHSEWHLDLGLHDSVSDEKNRFESICVAESKKAESKI